MIGPPRRAGQRALLLETVDTATTMAVHQAIRAAQLPEVADLVPAACTVLVTLTEGTDRAAAGRRLRELADGARTAGPDTGPHDPFVIPVRYDGPDLPDVLTHTGLTRAELVAAHTGTLWRAGFLGFAPGFAYLVGGDPRVAVPRRAQSRTEVPAGSVALAGEYSAVYPRPSPGGWQLIGRTDVVLWDERAEPAAALHPGRWVRFADADADVDAHAADATGDAADVAGVRSGSP